MMRVPVCLGLVALMATLVAPARAAESASPPLLVRLASIDTLTKQFFLLADKVGRKAEAELGWRPRHADLDAIVASAYRWHLAHPRGYAA